MDRLLALACFLFGVVVVATTSSDGSVAMLTTVLFASFAVLIIRTQAPEDKLFLTRIFVIALLARLCFGLLLHLFDLRDVFGGDASTYDQFGNILKDYWFGQSPEIITEKVLNQRMNGVGWGMLYLVAGLYSIIGQNVLAAQFFCAVIGAAIAPMIFTCSMQIFNNRRVAQVAAVLTALYPAFIIWTGQLMKDGLVIFLLVLAMVMVLRLQKEFNYFDLFLLIFSLFGIISLRFYIFYMIAIAIVGAFLIGYGDISKNLAKRLGILLIIGISLTYLGVLRYATAEFDKYGSLEVIQRSRDDAATRSDSGFAEGLDVSTPTGVIFAFPIGFTYLMLAPFPWQIVNLRQAITLPDMIIWWCSIPFLISGLIYSVKNRLKGSLGILTFSLMLSFAYSIFQGNVGTAYRQRTQIQVFLFIFIGVGWTLYKERKENRQLKELANNKNLEKHWRLLREKNLENLDVKEDIDVPNSFPNFFEKLETNSDNGKSSNVETSDSDRSSLPQIEKGRAKKKVFRAKKTQIEEAQKVLKEKKLYNGEISGKFNKGFRSAIRKYQKAQKIEVTGTLNELTLKKIGVDVNREKK